MFTLTARLSLTFVESRGRLKKHGFKFIDNFLLDIGVYCFALVTKTIQIIVAVTHTKVNSIPKVNSPRELRYRGAWGHTLNILTRSIIHT